MTVAKSWIQQPRQAGSHVFVSLSLEASPHYRGWWNITVQLTLSKWIVENSFDSWWKAGLDYDGWWQQGVVQKEHCVFLAHARQKKRTPNAGQFWWWCASAHKWRCMMGTLKCCLKRVSQFFIPAKFIYYAVLASLTAPKVLITRKWVILLLFSQRKENISFFCCFYNSIFPSTDIGWPKMKNYM